ncbi:MAG: hypothetical protein LBK67_09350 [Coriobacteriales bacterium]|jgi:hypothetical protein|nr:hypothetical protein [Coriobacteriales bacterium]
MNIIGIVTSVIGVVSLVALIYQAYNLRITIGNQIYQSFVTNSIEIDKILIKYPHLRKYVYDNEPVDDSTDELDRIMSVIELMTDITENIEVYRKYIPKTRYDGWMQFVKDTQRTGAYRYYMEKYGKWYAVK